MDLQIPSTVIEYRLKIFFFKSFNSGEIYWLFKESHLLCPLSKAVTFYFQNIDIFLKNNNLMSYQIVKSAFKTISMNYHGLFNS